MTPERFRECRELLHWSVQGLAEILGRQRGTVRQWQDGRTRIPDDVAAWLDKLAKFHERNPPPVRKAGDALDKPD